MTYSSAKREAKDDDFKVSRSFPVWQSSKWERVYWKRRLGKKPENFHAQQSTGRIYNQYDTQTQTLLALELKNLARSLA